MANENFVEEVVNALEHLTPLEHDGYREIQYNEDIFLHVWSRDEGEGAIEFEAIIPHDAEDRHENISLPEYFNQNSFYEFPGVSDFEKAFVQALRQFFEQVEADVVFRRGESYTTHIDRPHDLFWTEGFTRTEENTLALL